MNVIFVDNGSKDQTIATIEEAGKKLQAIGCGFKLLQQENKGFGAGNNLAIRNGDAPYCLITNVDLAFEADSITNIVKTAVADHANIAAWELRQKPFEHPKFYDPVSNLTNWNSHACVLLRRSALEKVGLYDENLFMYGEDVELSYRMRRGGYLLRYCPKAVVWHYTYESEKTLKPIQYTESIFANFYLRLKYGNFFKQIIKIHIFFLLFIVRNRFSGVRSILTKNYFRLLKLIPQILKEKRKVPADIDFYFNRMEYDLSREGSFFKQEPLSPEMPLVTVITRTYAGRGLYLSQAMFSVANQTYPNIEHVIVEDGGNTQQALAEQIAKLTGATIRFIAAEKRGRSNAGNVGLKEAKGKYCVFLDDDDLLFADHVEILAQQLIAQPYAAAAYALSWEVPTFFDKQADIYQEFSHSVITSTIQKFDFDLLRKQNYLPIHTVLFKTELFSERGGFEESLDALEDWNLWQRYAYKNEFIYVPKVTSLFRTPSDPATREARNKIFAEAYEPAITLTETSLIKLESRI